MKKLPDMGYVFWPVGNGDSTTIAVKSNVVMQVDLCHRTSAEDENDPKTPIVDKLVEILPKVDGDPYLSVFALTHPDEDHCCGFEELFKKVTIGELWFTPRIFDDDDVCEDAVVFMDEAMRRIRKLKANGGKAESGDRVRIIGYSEMLQDDDFKDLPKDIISVPGTDVTTLDGVDYAGTFKAFIHTPFKDDAEGERNDTSLGMQVTLSKDGYDGRALLFGDLCYPILKRVFEVSEKEDLEWNVFLAPHHCSKSVMYGKNDKGEEELKKDIMQLIKDNVSSPGYIVASSREFPDKDEDGACPPHLKARRRYEEIVPDDFLSTAEIAPDPIVFIMGDDGIELQNSQPSGASLAEAVAKERGAKQPPGITVGFGLLMAAFLILTGLYMQQRNSA